MQRRRWPKAVVVAPVLCMGENILEGLKHDEGESERRPLEHQKETIAVSRQEHQLMGAPALDSRPKSSTKAYGDSMPVSVT
jgi:hypothetical protein